MIRWLAAAIAAVASPAAAATLQVGPGRAYPTPSAAIAAAADGDTISIAPGQYFDCAIVGRSRLVIQGEGGGAVLTDRTCADKALLVIEGDGVTIRDLTLARARVPDGNGAGIRLDAPNATIERVTFDNDQVGVLASAGGGTIAIADCRFVGGGVGGERPLYAVMVPAARVLRISGSIFADMDGGQIETDAAQTELADNRIGAGHGEAPGVAVWVDAGALLMTGNVVTVGPSRLPRDTAVMLLDDADATLRDNRLVNTTGHAMVLLRDWSHASPVLAQNEVAPGDEVVSSGGITRHRLAGSAHAIDDGLHHAAGRLKRALQHLW